VCVGIEVRRHLLPHDFVCQQTKAGRLEGLAYERAGLELFEQWERRGEELDERIRRDALAHATAKEHDAVAPENPATLARGPCVIAQVMKDHGDEREIDRRAFERNRLGVSDLEAHA